MEQSESSLNPLLADKIVLKLVDFLLKKPAIFFIIKRRFLPEHHKNTTEGFGK